jgi:hypothetical protein
MKSSMAADDLKQLQLWRGYLPCRLAGRPMGPNVDMLAHRPNSGTRPRRQKTAFQRQSGAARSPPAWSCCGGSSDTTRPVRRGRRPDRQGSAVCSRLPAGQAAPPWPSLPLVCQQLDLFTLLPDRRRLFLDHPHQPFPFLVFPIQFGA